MNDISSETLASFTTLFGGLDSDELDAVTHIVRRREVDAGAVIIADGDTGDELYLLDEGTVDVYRTLTIVTSKHEFGTKERTFSRLSGDDRCFFGEMGIIGHNRRSATVKAASRCALLVIPADEFRTLAAARPNIGYVVVSNIALMLAGYLRKANDDVIKLTTALSLALSG